MKHTNPWLTQWSNVTNGGVWIGTNGEEKTQEYYIQTTTGVENDCQHHQHCRKKYVQGWRQRREEENGAAQMGRDEEGRIRANRIPIAMTTEGGGDLRLLQRPCRTRDDASPHDGGLWTDVHLLVSDAGVSGRPSTIGKNRDP